MLRRIRVVVVCPHSKLSPNHPTNKSGHLSHLGRLEFGRERESELLCSASFE
jgi:hypothetical protein